jgi:hypothetical protein
LTVEDEGKVLTVIGSLSNTTSPDTTVLFLVHRVTEQPNPTLNIVDLYCLGFSANGGTMDAGTYTVSLKKLDDRPGAPKVAGYARTVPDPVTGAADPVSGDFDLILSSNDFLPAGHETPFDGDGSLTLGGSVDVTGGSGRVTDHTTGTKVYACTATSDRAYFGPGNIGIGYSYGTGFPTVGASHQGRLFLSGFSKEYQNIILGSRSGEPDDFNTGPNDARVEGARFTPSGNLAFVSGKGIDFSATAGTGTSELLDDYEEGTWTSLVGGTATYGANSGRYTKIGRQVFATFDLNITTIGTGSTSVITGLPFPVGDAIAEGVSVNFYSGLANNVVELNAYVINSEIRFRAMSSAGSGLTEIAVLGSGCRVTGTAIYTV